MLAQQQSLLENFKAPVLLLRAKYASYERIADLLQEKKVRISVATVRTFCRKYDADMKRLRLELEGHGEPVADPPEETPPTTPELSPAREKRPALTSEPGKRGPRVARDQL